MNGKVCLAFAKIIPAGGRTMDYDIVVLTPENFHKCSNIWNMKRQSTLAERFYNEISIGNRITYVYKEGEEYLGEISLVFDMNDSDYTIENKRIYVSRLIVKPCARRKGIGSKLVDYAIKRAKEMSYSEMSIGVDLDNYPALNLYVGAGFNQIVFIGEDKQGKYLKLLNNNL